MNGIYLHLPFCIKKCLYCDFASSDCAFDFAEDYIDAVILEMNEYSAATADTVYFGGGTPTSLPFHLLERLILAVHKNFRLTDDAEITVECNPKTADYNYFKNLLDLGINRLSIGVQSLCDDELRFLGRAHTASDSIATISAAKEAGFKNISADLMFGLFPQTEKSVLASLSSLLSLSPQHISCYSLIVEENTPFGKRQNAGEVLQMPEDEERNLYRKITNVLEKNNYHRYEISNYAKDGFISRHNKKYWDRSDYIGLGAAAHSFWCDERFANPSDICEYINSIKNSVPRTKEKINKYDAIFEFIFLGLRKSEGISKSVFYKNFGEKLDLLYEKEITELKSLGLIKEENDYLYLTDDGIDVSNEVFVKFLR